MRRTLILILALGMMLAACSGDSQSSDGLTEDTTAMAAEPAEDMAGGETVSMRTPETRKVIHRASISIEADDTRAAYRRIQDMVQEADGFIESATIADPEAGEDQPRIDLTIRIPADDLTTTLEAIGALGTRIVSQSQQGQDVTEEYVDLEARIDNLTLLEDELRALLQEVRQNPEADPAKLLQVFNEISRVRGEIEQLEGRRQVLDDLTDLATVQVTVSPTPEVSPVVAEGWAPLVVARAALADLVTAFQGIGDIAIRFVVYILPLALIFLGIPGFLLWRFRRKLRFSRDIPGV